MLLIYTKSVIYSFMKRCYWLYRAMRIKTGKGVKVSHTLRIDGSGKIALGNFTTVEKNVIIGCAPGSTMSYGDENVLSEGVFMYSSANTSLVTGKNTTIANHSRCHINADWRIGDNVKIAMHCQIFSRESGFAGKLSIGSNTNIGDFSIIDVSTDISIGSNVALGPHVTIYTHDHEYMEPGIIAPWRGKAMTKPVIIEDNAWIGANVIILPGITIGKNAIVAAGSIVTKNISPRTINAGVPAKTLKNY